MAGRAGAQVYAPGYVVRTGGDTLRGEVENSFWREPPTFVRFRPAGGAASVLWQGRQLWGFGLAGGRCFRREPLPLDYAAQTDINKLVPGNPRTVRADSVLAEVLLDGPVTLWRVETPGSLHLLVRRPGQPVLDLAQRTLLQTRPTGTYYLDGNDYRAQLERYFGDCPAAVALLPGTHFTAADMAAVAQAYARTCSPARQPAQAWPARPEQPRRLALQGGVLAGVSAHAWQRTLTAGREGVDCLPHPVGGLYGELLLPSRTVALYGELLLSSYRGQQVQLVYTSGSSYSTYTTRSYKSLLATARLGLRYLRPLPRDQSLLLTLAYELNAAPNAPAVAATGTDLYYQYSDRYMRPILLPALGVAWRRQRLTLGLDAQLYNSEESGDSYRYHYFGTNFALRLGLGVRLGRGADARAATRP